MKVQKYLKPPVSTGTLRQSMTLKEFFGSHIIVKAPTLPDPPIEMVKKGDVWVAKK